MISRELFWEIVRLHKVEKLNSTQIGARLAMAPRSVRRFMRLSDYPAKAAERERPCLLEQHATRIRGLLDSFAYTVSQLHARLAEDGISCSYRSLARYVKTIHPKQPEQRGVLHVPNANGQLDLRVPTPDLSRFKTIKTTERNNHG